MAGTGISERVQTLISESNSPDPVTISQELLEQLSWDERAEGFGVFLPIIVSRFLTLKRNRRVPAPAAVSKNSGKPTKTNADLCREWWQEELRKSYVGADGWKFLGEFTIADFEYAIEERTDRAKAILASTQWMKKSVATMKEVGVARFDELAQELLINLLSAKK